MGRNGVDQLEGFGIAKRGTRTELMVWSGPSYETLLSGNLFIIHCISIEVLEISDKTIRAKD